MITIAKPLKILNPEKAVMANNSKKSSSVDFLSPGFFLFVFFLTRETKKSRATPRAEVGRKY